LTSTKNINKHNILNYKTKLLVKIIFHRFFYLYIRNKFASMKCLRILLFIICVSTINKSIAQKKIDPRYVNFKQPKLIASIGNYKDTMFISKLEADAVIGAALKVKTLKNENYVVTSYHFLYKKIVTSEDEETGKAYATTTNKSSMFKTTPLPPNWLAAVRENLKPGEDLIFFDIIAKDPQGRVMYAPIIKLTVK
jgi:hypothetical protein